jgi:hypothetical protein
MPRGLSALSMQAREPAILQALQLSSATRAEAMSAGAFDHHSPSVLKAAECQRCLLRLNAMTFNRLVRNQLAWLDAGAHHCLIETTLCHMRRLAISLQRFQMTDELRV